jgi:hypothetical protein
MEPEGDRMTGIVKVKENRERSLGYGVRYPRGYEMAAGRLPCKQATPESVEGLGMAGPDETQGSPWPPLAIRLWKEVHHLQLHIGMGYPKG